MHAGYRYDIQPFLIKDYGDLYLGSGCTWKSNNEDQAAHDRFISISAEIILDLMLRSEEAGNYAERLNICLVITNKQTNVAAGNNKGHVCLESVSGFAEYQANQKLTNCCLAIEINIILSHFLWEF